MTGVKHDEDKVTWENLPWDCIQEMAEVSSYGAKKYGVNNWQQLENRKGRYFSAAMRHISAWRRGEICDLQTGHHHLAHAAICLLYVMWGELCKK